LTLFTVKHPKNKMKYMY